MVATIPMLTGRVEDVQRSQLSSLSFRAECTSVLQDLRHLSSILHEYVHLYGENALQIEDSFNCCDRSIQLLVSRNGFRGRPAYIISKVQLETLVELGFNYHTIARILGVSERTILRRRVEFGLPVGYTFTDITDDDLDNVVRGILQVCEMVARTNVCVYNILLYMSHIYTHTCGLSIN